MLRIFKKKQYTIKRVKELGGKIVDRRAPRASSHVTLICEIDGVVFPITANRITGKGHYASRSRMKEIDQALARKEDTRRNKRGSGTFSLGD